MGARGAICAVAAPTLAEPACPAAHALCLVGHRAMLARRAGLADAVILTGGTAVRKSIAWWSWAEVPAIADEHGTVQVNDIIAAIGVIELLDCTP